MKNVRQKSEEKSGKTKPFVPPLCGKLFPPRTLFARPAEKKGENSYKRLSLPGVADRIHCGDVMAVP